MDSPYQRLQPQGGVRRRNGNAQATLTTHNNADNFLLGEAGATNSYNDALTACSLVRTPHDHRSHPVYYTTCTPAATYAFNPSPDVIAKVALDPVSDTTRSWTVRPVPRPCLSLRRLLVGGASNCAKPDTAVTGAYNSSKNGGGIGQRPLEFRTINTLFSVARFRRQRSGAIRRCPALRSGHSCNGTPDSDQGLPGLASLEWHGKKSTSTLCWRRVCRPDGRLRC